MYHVANSIEVQFVRHATERSSSRLFPGSLLPEFITPTTPAVRLLTHPAIVCHRGTPRVALSAGRVLMHV